MGFNMRGLAVVGVAVVVALCVNGVSAGNPLLRKRSVSPQPPSGPGRVVAEYFRNEILNRGLQNPWDLDLIKVTHLHYAAYEIKGDCTVESPYQWLDEERVFEQVGMSYDPSIYDGPKGGIGAFKLIGEYLRQLRDSKGLPPLKIILSIIGPENFSSCTGSAAERSTLVDSVEDLLSRLPIDGVEFSWNTPVAVGNGPGSMTQNEYLGFVQFLQDVRSRIDAVFSGEKLLVASQQMTSSAIDKISSDFCGALDLVYLTAYNYAGGWDSVTGINSALEEDPGQGASNENISWGVDEIAKTCPLNKLVLGVPTFGSCWSDVADVNNGLYQSSLGGACHGPEERGILPYKVIAERLEQSVYVRYWNNLTKTPYLFNDDEEFVAYDDADSIEQKAFFSCEHGMAGVMVTDSYGDAKNGEPGVEIMNGLVLPKYVLLSAATTSEGVCSPTSTSTGSPTSSTTTSTTYPMTTSTPCPSSTWSPSSSSESVSISFSFSETSSSDTSDEGPPPSTSSPPPPQSSTSTDAPSSSSTGAQSSSSTSTETPSSSSTGAGLESSSSTSTETPSSTPSSSSTGASSIAPRRRRRHRAVQPPRNRP